MQTTCSLRSVLWKHLIRRRAMAFGLTLIVLWMALAALAPAVCPSDPYDMSFPRLEPPSSTNLLGTDQFGRDVLTLVIYGARVSLIFGFGVAILSSAVGAVLGAVPGYFGGLVDDLISRFTEIFLMMPVVLVAIIGAALFGNSTMVAVIIVTLTLWPTNARIMRGEVLRVKQQEYVQAAIACGAGQWRILVRHILPNAVTPVVTSATLQMGLAILVEAGLGFVGLGDPNHPSWGQLLHKAQYTRSSWWLSVFPGLAITSLLLGVRYFGDGLNEMLARGSRN